MPSESLLDRLTIHKTEEPPRIFTSEVLPGGLFASRIHVNLTAVWFTHHAWRRLADREISPFSLANSLAQIPYKMLELDERYRFKGQDSLVVVVVRVHHGFRVITAYRE